MSDHDSTNRPASPPGRPSGAQRGYLIALLAMAAAFALRISLDSLLRDRLPYFTFFLATIFCAWYCGSRPALAAMLGGWVLGDWFFDDDRHRLGWPNETGLLAAFTYLLASGTTIFFSRHLHRARELADSNAATALQNQHLLELEVADRKRIEAEVRRLNAELERRVADRTAELVNLNQELESFTYSVSHDLRAPLRHIDGYTQILAADFGATLPGEARELLDKVRAGSQNMGRLVDDLLNLSRVGQKELDRRPVALDLVVAAAREELAAEAAGREIEWRLSPLPNVACDPGLIKQVFINLLSNAIKYTRPRARAAISVDHFTQGGELVFRIRDNGVGFDPRFAEKLFGVFQRLHPASEFEGTGIGLATVARIIRKHGGRIWAEAEPNQGASFQFTLAAVPQFSRA